MTEQDRRESASVAGIRAALRCGSYLPETIEDVPRAMLEVAVADLRCLLGHHDARGEEVAALRAELAAQRQETARLRAELCGRLRVDEGLRAA